jgi:hypothetical protein
LPEILSTDLSDNIVNITGMTYCDSGCAAGQASLLCPFPEDPLNAPVRIAFDMDQARTITQSYCDQTANCYFEEAPIIVEEDPEIIAATDMASQRVAQAHELTSGTPDPDLDEALPEAAAVNDPVVDDGDYELPPLATLPPVAGDEVTDLYVPPDEISERVAQAHALASGTPDMDATVPETVTTSDLVIDYEDYERPPLAMLPPIGVTDAFDSILTDIPDDTNPLTGAFNDNNMDLEIVTGNPLHIVEVGDNLWDIAEQEYGDGEMYRVIVQANLEKYPELLEHPDLIQPDMELVIPPADAPAADCVTGNVQSHRPTICAPAMHLAA